MGDAKPDRICTIKGALGTVEARALPDESRGTLMRLRHLSFAHSSGVAVVALLAALVAPSHAARSLPAYPNMKLTVSPSAVPAAGRITAVVAGVPAGTPVQVTLKVAKPVALVVNTDAGGTAVAEFPLEYGPGKYSIVAIAGKTSVKAFAYLPLVTWPKTVTVGKPTRIRVSYLPPGALVAVDTAGPLGLVTSAASNSGSAAVQLTFAAEQHSAVSVFVGSSLVARSALNVNPPSSRGGYVPPVDVCFTLMCP